MDSGRRRAQIEWRRWLYDLAAHYRPHANTGTPYNCSEERIVRTLTLQGPSNLESIHVMQATYDLVEVNNIRRVLSPEQERARQRVQSALEVAAWEPDIVIKAFKDLDTLFFGGQLFGHCQVRWLSIERWRAAGKHPDALGETAAFSYGQAKVWLNADLILRRSPKPKVTMFEVLLHELCHAYEFVMSGAQPDTDHDILVGHERGHGIIFCTCIQAVHKRAVQILDMIAISPDNGHLMLDKFSKREFRDFFVQMAEEGQRQRAWDMYYGDLPPQAWDIDPSMWVHELGRYP